VKNNEAGRGLLQIEFIK